MFLLKSPQKIYKMFLYKSISTQSNNYKKCLLHKTLNIVNQSKLKYSGVATYLNTNNLYNHNNRRRTTLVQNCNSSFLLHRKWFSRGLIDGDITTLASHENELKKIKEIFPEPRVTLHILSTKTPEKVFDIIYKQSSSVATKGARKKIIQNNDWTCTYVFTWPEKVKFESSAISKRQAAEKAATQAVHWLYINKRLDSKGAPVYDKNVLNEIQSTLNEPIKISISDKSMERIDTIWNDYESGIKDIYEATFKEARSRHFTKVPAVFTKDSTIDQEDCLEKDGDIDEDLGDLSEVKSRVHPVYGKNWREPSASTLERRDSVLNRKFSAYDEDLTPLPIDEYAEQITSTLEESRAVVIVGAAGCGKSTRVPAAVLRHCGVETAAIVSEPRRVAAIGLAERVANELGEEVGDTIGYQVRLHSKLPRPPAGSILYCTSGVLLRRLHTNPGLVGCSHVFIDEAHERDVNTDVTLLLLKRAMDVNPRLKVVVMSATLDTEVFTRYFNSCPVIEVPGRTFPVEVSHLEDVQKKFNIQLPITLENCRREDGRPQINCDEIAEVIKAVDKTEGEGAILVFLPGWSEIKHTMQLLNEHYGQSGLHIILPVHSRLSTTEQTKMFAKPPPGIRKIVLSTNVAETSITIPDVVYVIDSGAHKENRLVERTGTASLETVWVSLAGAKQRAGRAGRVQPGHCYRVYTKEKEEEFVPHTTPEILRIPLEQTVLDCKTYAPDDKVQDFLSQLPEPPSKKAIQLAINDLIDLGALTPSQQLTRLGGLLSTLTLHPRLGCSLLHAVVVGNVVAVANVLTHCAGNIELFTQAPDRREEIREIKRKFSATSDHCALHWLQEEFEAELDRVGWKGLDEWCTKYGVRKERLGFVKSLSSLYLEQVLKSGMVEATIDAQELNRFSDIDELTVATFLSGVDSILTTKKYIKNKGKLATTVGLYTSRGDRAHIGSESVNHAVAKRSHKASLLTHFGGQHSVERRALIVYRASLLPTHAALLLCRRADTPLTIEGNEETTIIHLPKHKLNIHVPTSQAENIVKMREMIWRTFQYYIERDVKNLQFDDYTNVARFKVRLFKAVGRILVEGDRERVQGKSGTESIEDIG